MENDPPAKRTSQNLSGPRNCISQPCKIFYFQAHGRTWVIALACIFFLCSSCDICWIAFTLKMSRHVARIPLHLFVRFLAQPACGTHTVWRLVEVRPYETTCLVCHGNVVVGLCRLRARIRQVCTLQLSYGGSLVTNVGSIGWHTAVKKVWR